MGDVKPEMSGDPIIGEEDTPYEEYERMYISKPFDKTDSLLLKNETNGEIFFEKDKRVVSSSNSIDLGQEIEIENIQEYVSIALNKSHGRVIYRWL